MPEPRSDHEHGRPEGIELSRFERWATDSDGKPIIEWDDEDHAAWCDKWAPGCPDGNPLRLGRALGFRERNVGELELRVALGGDDLGVCDVIIEERDDEVYVRVLVHYDDADGNPARSSRGYLDCPVRTWLERPLGDRAVIDVDSDEELALFTPQYMNNVRQPDHGYHPARRRRAPAEPRPVPGPP